MDDAPAPRSTWRHPPPAGRQRRPRRSGGASRSSPAATEFDEFLEREFPRQAAGIATAGRPAGAVPEADGRVAGARRASGACTRQPDGEDRPVRAAARAASCPGEPLFFATAMPLGGFGDRRSWSRATRGGRPRSRATRSIPASLGATDVARAGARCSALYDPDRSQVVTSVGRDPTVERASSTRCARRSTAQRAQRRRRAAHPHRARSPRRRSPRRSRALLARRSRRRAGTSGSRSARDSARAGRAARLRRGRRRRSYRFDARRRRSSSLDADFLALRPGARALRARLRRAAPRRATRARDEPALRRRAHADRSPARVADHRLPLARRRRRGASRARSPPALGVRVRTRRRRPASAHAAWIDARRARPASAPRRRASSIAGDAAAAAGARARARDEPGARQRRAARSSTPSRSRRSPTTSARRCATLVADMDAGRGRAAAHPRRQPGLHGAGRPRLRRARSTKVALRVHLGLYDDETAALCHWHVPEAHYLEAWSDVRAYDGTATHRPAAHRAALRAAGRAHELLAALVGPAGPRRATTSCATHWQQARAGRRLRGASGARRCTTASSPARAAPRAAVALRADWDRGADAAAAGRANGLEIVFRPDPTVLDGRFANNGWLQELPRPLTKLTWDNAALVAPGHGGAARRRERGRRRAALPRPHACARRSGSCPGHARRRGHACTSATAARAPARVGNGVGFDAYALRTARRAVVRRRARRSRKTGERHRARDARRTTRRWRAATLVRAATLDGVPRAIPTSRSDDGREPAARPDALPAASRTTATPGAWRSTSTPASAATPASSPARRRTTSRSSARTQVARGREMHWIRVDRYYEGDLDDARDPTTSRCRACTARTRPARSSARWTRPCTAARA